MARQAIPRATDEDNTLIEAQELRFQERQRARSGIGATAAETELAELISQLDAEDVAVLVTVARRLRSDTDRDVSDA